MFRNCSTLTNLRVRNNSGNIIDLSACSSLNTFYSYGSYNTVTLPNNDFQYIAYYSSYIDGSLINKNVNYFEARASFASFTTAKIKNVCVCYDIVIDWSTFTTTFAGSKNSLEIINYYTIEYYRNVMGNTLGKIGDLGNYFPNLSSIYISGDHNPNLISGIENVTSLKYLTLYDTNLSDISKLANLPNITYLRLDYNSISNITSLSKASLDQIDIEGELQPLILSNNSISNLTPLLGTIGSNNKIKYKELELARNPLDGYTVVDNILVLLKLHEAGLEKITITGCDFSSKEINELINGKTVTNEDGTKTTYAGFGSGNVIN